MKIDLVSDTHGFYPEDLPGGDLLIIAGDLTGRDTLQEHLLCAKWMADQKYKKIVFIAGNHDGLIQTTDLVEDVYYDFTYLCDSGTEFNGLKIWGSPWTKRFKGMNPKCMAFTVDTEEELDEKWRIIPEYIDILITHSPPFGFLDEVYDPLSRKFKNVGSVSLIHRMQDIWPRLHVFGHIHNGYGKEHLSADKEETILVNASIMNEYYEPVNKPIRITL